MVHYKLNIFGIIKNSFLLSMSFLPTSLLAALVLVAMFVLFLWQPFTVFVSFSVGGYLIFTLCNKVFTRKENLN
jgi:uncharacterized membrane protein YesL